MPGSHQNIRFLRLNLRLTIFGGAMPYLRYLFKKLKRIPLSVWLKKLFLQFCYLILYLGNETVSCGLLRRIVRYGMDWNLGKMGQFFQGFAVATKIAKNYG